MASPIQESQVIFSTNDILQLSTGRSPLFHSDPWPLYVRYENGKTVFVPRDRFYFRDPAGPSSCLWIVPGTAF